MFKLRFLTPMLFALLLLFAQQGSAVHALQHVFAAQAEQQNKQLPHSQDCEQCTTYAQLGSALNSGQFSFDFCASQAQAYTQNSHEFFTRHSLPAVARGPPCSQVSA